MAATYNVNKNVLAWAVESSENNIPMLKERYPKIEGWLSETSEIPIGTIEKLSKSLNIPFGYFFLEEIPSEEVTITNYRTIDNEFYHHASRNLLDVIYEMERKQDFVRQNRIEEGYSPLSFIKRFKQTDNFMEIANDIRKVLGFSIDWNYKTNHPYNKLRNYLNRVGILIFKNGIVKSNTRRSLNLEEFRAFVLIDNYAPLIFINAKDSQTAQLFSICHELAHIWLGEPELLNTYKIEAESNVENKELERLCNQIAAELLLPQSQIDKHFNNDYSTFKIETVARELRISPQVVAIKLKQENKLSSKQFDKLYDELIVLSEKNLKNKEKRNDGKGNFYNTSLSRLDHSFIELVNRKTSTGELAYTEAFNFLNIKSGNTYDNLISQLEV